MGRYELVHKCGHSYSHNIKYSKDEPLDLKLESLKSTICPRCHRHFRNIGSMVINEINGLPTLYGSKKQILWAEGIRTSLNSKLCDIETAVNDWSTKEKLTRQEIYKVTGLMNTLAYIRRQTSAAWWIDNRETPIRKLIRSTLLDILKIDK